MSQPWRRDYDYDYDPDHDHEERIFIIVTLIVIVISSPWLTHLTPINTSIVN